jgi:Lon-like ATP-dependent protease
LQNIKEGIEGRAVTWYPEVFDLVFPNLDRAKANACKACEWKRAHPEEKKGSSSAGDEE